MNRYEHQQHATWMYWIGIAIFAVLMIVTRSTPAAGGPLAMIGGVIALSIAIFSRLTIAVDAATIAWRFGWGWPGGSIPLAQIKSIEITQTNLLEGYGIHWTIWHGWLWNVSGFRAVEMTKSDGSRVTLGTDDPEGLYDAIVANRRALE